MGGMLVVPLWGLAPATEARSTALRKNTPKWFIIMVGLLRRVMKNKQWKLVTGRRQGGCQ